MEEIKVSIILATYNSNWKKLKRTIDSIVEQKKVFFELLIADDGSMIDLEKQINDYLTSINFNDFCYIKAEKNQGTVSNLFNALKKAKYFWVKFISPGDMLFNDLVLYNWITFMLKANVEMSFGRSIYYSENGEIKESIEYPINKAIFDNINYSSKEAFLDYVFLKDVPNGASFLGKKDVYVKYLSKIVGKIRYAEDMIYRLMLSERVKIFYYSDNVIWYEYGTGISTSRNSKWEHIINNERIICNKIIEKNEMKIDLINKRVKLSLRLPEKLDFFKYLLIPELIKLKIVKSKLLSYTSKTDALELLLEKKYEIER